MNAKPTKEHLDAFVAHSMATLPDSFRLRKTVLITLLSLLPKKYEGRFQVAQVLEALHTHENAQLKFAALQTNKPGNGFNA